VTTYDVAVVGGGPGGATTAACLARAGVRVAVFERERFPRFHVGESLMPATLPLLDRLGAGHLFANRGFQIKYGAYFHNQETGSEYTFYFADGKPWPNYSYQVPRADFDLLLLEHARKLGADVFQPAEVQRVAFDDDGVTLGVAGESAPAAVRARMLVDASGRDSLLASHVGRRRRVPNLGKVALFAHFRGASRAAGRDEGNIRIYVFEDGWFWWIPLAGDLTSVGCVMHARTVRDRTRDIEALYGEMIARCRRVADGLRHAERVTPIHRASNFSYTNEPIIGDRFIGVGDTIGFIDPIFSGGVYIAMQSGELAAEAIVPVLRDGRFKRSRFRAYQRRVRAGMAPLFKLIHKYYEPAFLELLLHPKPAFGMMDAVLSVLAGGFFLHQPWRTRLSLRLVFAIARVATWVNRVRGRPYRSRLEW
jgi:flavin-dependent dehydrogenase